MTKSEGKRGDSNTIVCRCESLRWSDIESAIAAGATSISDMKRRTRAGMGPCQGIYCMPFLENALTGCLVDDEPMTMRPPARPITLAELSASSDPE